LRATVQLLNVAPGREAEVLEEDQQVEEIIARVAALDVGKAELVCCVRVPHEGRQAGSAAAGGGDLFDDDPLVAEAGRPADQR
jgi:hypothetical protein